MKWAFAVACVATASADEGSPIGKVIGMISDSIKMLNDDDALELFKKTLPLPSCHTAISDLERSLADGKR